MSDTKVFSRRRALKGGLGVAGGGLLLATGATALATPALAAEAAPGEKKQDWRGDTSANGWRITGDGIAHHVVEGSNLTVELRTGDVATVLLYALRRFHYEVDHRLTGKDVTGHTVDRAVAAGFESNALSGTAFTVRPDAYPLGARDCFFPEDVAVIRDILADCEGTVRWGGDEPQPKQSHFQIDVGPGDAKLARVAAKIRSWDAEPGSGAGTVDAFAPGRRPTADALARRQAA
ncbi:hypothetical protein ACFVFQ_34935 [Streptomyces sp. NPDC057743]|uniref:hypothetical protein n=1 Tax=Streptomyces sp. NPDC057743 TaxID=3346236 RepID=UPI0036B44289